MGSYKVRRRALSSTNTCAGASAGHASSACQSAGAQCCQEASSNTGAGPTASASACPNSSSESSALPCSSDHPTACCSACVRRQTCGRASSSASANNATANMSTADIYASTNANANANAYDVATRIALLHWCVSHNWGDSRKSDNQYGVRGWPSDDQVTEGFVLTVQDAC